jgi:DNA-binding SARP family transcriptional activator
MDFRILGPLEVLENGRAITLTGSKQRALLAMLLLHAGETVTTDRLIDELWGERPPAGGPKSLQMQISRLRKVLAGSGRGGSANPILTQGRGYRMAIEPEQLDAHRFEQLVAQGRGELEADRPEAAAPVLEEALALWRGSPLADLAYEPFAQTAVARLDELRVAALEHLIEAKLALGAHAEVVPQLEAVIAEHPYREGPRALLMLALYRCDRQAEALQAYQDARGALVEELGIEPGERLRELERGILAQDPGLQLVVASAPPAGEPQPDAPRRAFVGRDRELSDLAGALDGAIAGSGRLVLLAGEPGIGKSRLADALMEQARRRGALVAAGRCWEAGGAPPYWPWIQVLRTVIRDTEAEALRTQLAGGASDLAQLLPELRERFASLPEPPALDREGARFRLFEATGSFLRAAAEARPLVVVLDDLHAADEPSLLLLEFVARGLAQSRMLVTGAYRDVDPVLRAPLTAALAELVRESHTVQIALGGLTAADIAEYVEIATGIVPASGLADAIRAETEGNPLFVSETVHLLAAEGRVAEAGARVRIPPSVRAVIGHRLERLSESCQATLVWASVIGREFGFEALGAVGALEHGTLMDALSEAMAEGVLEDVPGTPGRLRFAHQLIRDVLYERVTLARRMQLHKEVGDALEVLYAPDPEPHLAELAQHFVAAAPVGARDKASGYARRAGDRAAGQLAFEEAARHYEIALTLAENPRARCELLLAMGDAHARAGDTPASKRAFREAADLAERADFVELLARAAFGYGGRFAWARGSTDPALVPLLERALAAIGDEDGRTRVRLLARLAAAARDEPSGGRRAELGDEALRIARESGDPATLAWAIEGRWIAIEGPARYLRREGLAVGDELISLGGEIGDREKVFAGHDHRLHSVWVMGDRHAVDAELRSLEELAEELRQPAQRWHVGTGRAILALMEGRFADAETLIAETLAIGERAETWNAAVSARLELFVLRRAQGRLAEVEEVIARSVDEYPSLPRFPAALAHLHAELGHEPKARAVFDELLARDLARHHRDAEWLFTISVLADPCARLEDWDAAAELYSMLLPYERLYAHAPVEVCFGSVARALGILAMTMHRWREAERHYHVAIEAERTLRARPWVAHSQHHLADGLLARGDAADAERARALLDEAVATYGELGMDTWATRAEALADRAS